MNAVIYARYSSDNQREESIEDQLRECKEYADQNGTTVVRTYIDRGTVRQDRQPPAVPAEATRAQSTVTISEIFNGFVMHMIFPIVRLYV